MNNPLKAIVLTLFPEMFPGPLGISIMGRALKEGRWTLDTLNIRDFAIDKHNTVDDNPYGGGAGMVMRPNVVASTIRQAKEQMDGETHVVFMTPSGKPFEQSDARRLAEKKNLILLCGHYEGIDQRVLDSEVDEELSIGDYVLSGGELGAMVVLDAVVRNIPSVLGNNETLHEESFDIVDGNGNQLIEYPHYTRPETWEGHTVPEVLTSGHHGKISQWRLKKAEEKTKKIRPDLLKK